MSACIVLIAGRLNMHLSYLCDVGNAWTRQQQWLAPINSPNQRPPKTTQVTPSQSLLPILSLHCVMPYIVLSCAGMLLQKGMASSRKNAKEHAMGTTRECNRGETARGGTLVLAVYHSGAREREVLINAHQSPVTGHHSPRKRKRKRKRTKELWTCLQMIWVGDLTFYVIPTLKWPCLQQGDIDPPLISPWSYSKMYMYLTLDDPITLFLDTRIISSFSEAK